MLMVTDAVEGHADARVLPHHLGPCWKVLSCSSCVDMGGLCCHLQLWRHPCLAAALSVSVVLPQSGSVMSMAHGDTNGHMDVQGLGHILWPC